MRRREPLEASPETLSRYRRLPATLEEARAAAAESTLSGASPRPSPGGLHPGLSPGSSGERSQ